MIAFGKRCRNVVTIDINNITWGYTGRAWPPGAWRPLDHMPDEYGQLLGLLEHAGHSAESVSGICLASGASLTGKIIEACRRYLGKEPSWLMPG
jgi:hypothetical protein